MSDSEPDFDDPRFLVDAATTSINTPELTYAEKRRRTIGRGREKAQQQQSQGSRKQREEQAREEGLSRNLIAADTLGEATEGESKALRMMRQMGFQLGQGLGRRASPSPPPPAAAPAPPSAEPSAFAGLGARPRPRPPSPTPLTDQPPSQKARTEPLKFELREKRTGLGVPSSKPARYRPPSSSTPAPSAADLEADRTAYLLTVKSTVDARRAVGLFRALRRTGDELDTRAGREGNVMWRDEEGEAKEEKAMRRRRLEGFGDDEESVGENRAGRGRRKGGGELDYAQGASSTVVSTSDSEDEDGSALKQEEQAWFAHPIPDRLSLAQAYLREKYHYCQWCGVQYEGEEDLEASCPGVGEEDH